MVSSRIYGASATTLCTLPHSVLVGNHERTPLLSESVFCDKQLCIARARCLSLYLFLQLQ